MQLVYNSINIRKIKFIAYIYIKFYPEFDEKSIIREKFEDWKHLHAVLVLSENSVTDAMTSPTFNRIVDEHVFLRHLQSCDVAWLDVIIDITFHWVYYRLFCKCTEYVNIKTSLTFKCLIEHLLADFSYSRPLDTYL